jgi:hypothetical protein
MARIIRPKNWGEFQHYKDRSPIWIKLHKRLLDDFDFQSLPVASRALAPMLWLLASEYDDGDIPGDVRKIAFRLRMSLQELSDAFDPLEKAGFFEVIGDASEALAEPERAAIPEKENKRQVTSDKRETEKENPTLRVGQKKRTPRISLPEDFPNEAAHEEARQFWGVHGRFDLIDKVLQHSEQFRDYHASRGSTMADWPAAWRTWARNSLEFNKQTGVSKHDKGTLGAAIFLADPEGNGSENLRDRAGTPSDSVPTSGHGPAQMGRIVPHDVRRLGPPDARTIEGRVSEVPDKSGEQMVSNIRAIA